MQINMSAAYEFEERLKRMMREGDTNTTFVPTLVVFVSGIAVGAVLNARRVRVPVAQENRPTSKKVSWRTR